MVVAAWSYYSEVCVHSAVELYVSGSVTVASVVT